MKTWKIGWKVGYVADDYEWIEAENKREARKLCKAANAGSEAEIVSIEERVNTDILFEEAFDRLVELFKPMKHLEIDDCRGAESWFVIPVFYVWMNGNRPESEQLDAFRFSRKSYESEAEMVKRFHEELDEFITGRNWKKLDK